QGGGMKALTLCVVFFLTVLCCVSITANAQSDRGSIVGTIKDPNGAVVSKAKVTVTSLDSGEVREVETSDEGNYTFAELKAAPYKISVQATGFKTATIDLVRVAVQVTRRQDINLEVGNVGESVIVTSDSQTLQTESPVQQTNVTEKQVRELPLQIGSETAG